MSLTIKNKLHNRGMMQVTKVKQGGTAWNFALHLQIMGYFLTLMLCVSFHHSTQRQEGKEKIILLVFYLFFSSASEDGFIRYRN